MATRIRTRPQLMPAVKSSIIAPAVTFSTSEVLPDSFDLTTRRALAQTLGAIDADLDWRHGYVHDNQLGTGAEFWKGRRPADDSDILDMLVQDDQLSPCMGREVDAQFGKDPEWDAMKGADLIDAQSEPVPAMTTWHDQSGLIGAAKEAAEDRWWSGSMVGRVYIPDAYQELLDSPGRRPTTLEGALELVHVQAVDPREGGPIIDRHKRVLGYYYRYERDGDNGQIEKMLEVHTQSDVLTFVDKGGRLTLDVESIPSPYADTGQTLRRSEYLMWHAHRKGGSAITQSLRDAQDSLNIVKSYWRRNDDATGYRQFIVSNAEQPKDRTGAAVPFQMGPGVAINLRGLPIDAVKTTSDAKPQRHMPKWEVVDPLNPEKYHVPSSKGWKTDILEKCDQLWTLNPESQVSGESKRQSRKPFDKRVTFAGQDMGGFVSWALRSALLLAAQVIDQVAAYEDVSFKTKIYLDVDAANLDELRIKQTMQAAGQLTLLTLLEATPGVADAAKEEEALKKELADGSITPERQAALNKLLQPEKVPAGAGTGEQ